MKKKVKGFKGFESDLSCRGFRYEVGKTYEIDGEIELCSRGFHFCQKLFDVNSFYSFRRDDYRFCEVEALGDVITEENGTKSVTNKIKIVREIPKEEFLEMANVGRENTGFCNTGYRNTGYRNTGDRNTGDWNTGYRNTGYRNTGDRNTGDWNTGDRNTGDWNTGDWNTGDWNTGDWNKTDHSSGVFCNERPKLMMFNKKTDMTIEEWRNTRAYDLLWSVPKSKWVFPGDMTEEEKQKYPSYETCGGYLKEIPRAEASKTWWEGLDNYDKAEIFNLPNFNLKVFNDIMELNITRKEYNEVMKNVNK